MNSLSDYINELSKSSPKLRSFRLFTFTSNPSLNIINLFISEPSLHLELYNYLWASYFSIPPSQLSNFASIASFLLSSILNFPLNSASSPVLPYQTSSHKQLFGKLDIEQGLCNLIPLLVPIKQKLPINKLMLYMVQEHFNKLKLSVQLTLIVLSEQLGIEFPVHKILSISENIEGCKMLRILFKLANVSRLFLKTSPIFTADQFLSLVPLPFNSSFSVKTTKIFKKVKVEKESKIDFFLVKIEDFSNDFNKNPALKENFSSKNISSLTRFLILFGYALHKILDLRLLNSFVTTLRVFNGFFDVHQVMLAGTALRSYAIFTGIYEFQEKWVSMFRAQLFLALREPIELLKDFLGKVEQEDIKLSVILSCYLYCQKNGIGKNSFLDKLLPDKNEDLIRYVVR